MNLKVLKPSRKRVQVGDVFAMLPPDGLYLFGRVISVDATPFGGAPEFRAVLVYVFRLRAATPTPPDLLPADALLVPPLLTNRLPWTRGYLETVQQRALAPGEQLERHVFRDHSSGRFLDENGAPANPVGIAVGDFALASLRTIDDRISAALGLPLAAD